MIQLILMNIGKSNPYAVKKYLFILFSFAVIESISLLSMLIRKIFEKALGIDLFAPLSGAIVLLAPFIAFGFFKVERHKDMTQIIELQKQAIHYCQYLKKDHNQIMAKFPIHPANNFLINTGSLNVEPNTAFVYAIKGDQEFNKIYTGDLMLLNDGTIDAYDPSVKFINNSIVVVDFKTYHGTSLGPTIKKAVQRQ